MLDLVVRIKESWLDKAVPYSLDSMDDYASSLAQVDGFAGTLKDLAWPGADTFDDWVQGAPKIWLSKRREEALDQVRNGLSAGMCLQRLTHHRCHQLGTSYFVQRNSTCADYFQVYVNPNWHKR